MTGSASISASISSISFSLINSVVEEVASVLLEDDEVTVELSAEGVVDELVAGKVDWAEDSVVASVVDDAVELVELASVDELEDVCSGFGSGVVPVVVVSCTVATVVDSSCSVVVSVVVSTTDQASN